MTNRRVLSTSFFSRFRCAVLALLALAPTAAAAGFVIRANAPNVVSFDPQPARAVRLVITSTSGGGQVCLDELEVYGPDSEANLALSDAGAVASASSSLAGYAIHRVEHLNDGKYGNSQSWIAAGTGEEWARIDLPETKTISRLVFSRDREGRYTDRVPTAIEVQVSPDGEQWATVFKESGRAVIAGQPLSLPAPPPPPEAKTLPYEDALAEAFVGEEHAWLKTWGRADLSDRLVPYNGRVTEYPRHVGDDVLPLATLPDAPALACGAGAEPWPVASRGVARVAWPHDPANTPLVEYALAARRTADSLYLEISTNRLLSSHIAIVSAGDWTGWGVVAWSDQGLVFNLYDPNRQVVESRPVEGGADAELQRFRMRLPLEWFPGWETEGIRVGLGLGGRHTSAAGRPIMLYPAPFAMEQVPAKDPSRLRVLLWATGSHPVTIEGPGGPLPLREGDFTRVMDFVPEQGSVGPQYDLTLRCEGNEYSLHMFRYDPAARVLTLMEDLADRLEAKGLDVSAERAALAAFQERHAALQAAPDDAASRALYLEARSAKRDLFLRDPDLEPLTELLFVKRNPFEPSHNYSDCFDAPWRPGGGICRVSIPWADGRLRPEQAVVTPLFDSGAGIARNPAATYDLGHVYFAYRPAADGYYHIMRMNPDGSGLTQLTDGPFHDYWPTPLPDGGIAFIGTRCTSRALCWRPQSAVLFRMDADGGDIRPVSLANLTEWAPSVMRDGRIIWTRWEYLDKGADFGHTLWAIRPDGTHPELVFGNTIVQPNGYANGREVPGTNEICCTLISHFGDLNGPIALLDLDKGPFDPSAITSVTPEVPWPGMWPNTECFRDPVPIARDLFLCSHAPWDRFGLFVIDRFGNRELLYTDPAISSMCPTLFRVEQAPPALAPVKPAEEETGEFVLADVYHGLGPDVARGSIKYLRVIEEVRHNVDLLPDGRYREDHEAFIDWYASPVDKVYGPNGWPSYVAKAPVGLVPVEEDGSARFTAPAGKVLYFQALDQDYNEVQRMRSVLQLQPGESRSCIGCHENRQMAPPAQQPLAMMRPAREPEPPSWGAGPFDYAKVVQPVLDKHCTTCHDGKHPKGLDFTGVPDRDHVPASYRTLITQGLVHYVDCGWNSGGCEKLAPLTFGTVKSPLWETLNKGHHDVKLSRDDTLRIKTWIDMNCPLWPDYTNRNERRDPTVDVARR